VTTTGEVSLEALLDFVKRSRGFDFTGYKRTSLERRIQKRMEEVGSKAYGDYLDHLEVDQDEFSSLFNTILINVTGFYRDAATWEYLREEVLPDLVAARAADAPLRVWCAGCASGEEPYTMAMVLADLLGEGAYRERVKIYATDVDEEALRIARAASYSAKQVEPVPPEALDTYFERMDSRYVFRPDLRRTVIFGRNDLVQDAPISRIDVLLCRNTLMYLNAETQAHVLRRFHFGLDDGGVLVVGKSEMLITRGHLFTPVDLKRRVFRKVVSGSTHDRQHFVASPAADAVTTAELTLRDMAFDTGPVAQVVVDDQGRLVSANQAARELFSLGISDLGRPLQDLELSYRPIELRSQLDTLRSERRARTLTNVAFRSGSGERRMLDVQITPLLDDGELHGVSVSYVDVTVFQALQEDLRRSKDDLEQAYEELQSTVEELETTNEELQSTNEELETTNEELQSTNEELETTNEELQSTNEELETINGELRTRTLELNELNAFLETILATIGIGVAVLDGSQNVRRWNRYAEDLWGVRADEAEGRPLADLDIGLPVDGVRSAIRTALAAEEPAETTVDAMNRRGKAIRCRVRCVPLRVMSDHVSGVIMLMEAQPRTSA
jgi:two-component system CheB/CheR fusion protein